MNPKRLSGEDLKVIHVRVTKDQHELLKKKAKDSNVCMSPIVRVAISNLLDGGCE